MTIRNLDFLFAPKTVALIFTSRHPGKIADVLTANLLGTGFKREIYLVEPKDQTSQEGASYPAIADLPQAPDLAVIATPPD